MSFVLDSSVALSWCFRDEQSEESAAILHRARTETIFVPNLWHVEMANVLGLALRRNRMDEMTLAIALRMFASLDLHTECPS